MCKTDFNVLQSGLDFDNMNAAGAHDLDITKHCEDKLS